MKKSILVGAVLCAVTGLAFAEGKTYGWQKGQNENQNRHEVFAKIADFKTDAEREAFFEQNEIGGDGPYHSAEHPDTDGYDDEEMKKLQKTFEKTDLSKMNESQRQKFYEGLKK